jgi:hypothetical protein
MTIASRPSVVSGGPGSPRVKTPARQTRSSSSDPATKPWTVLVWIAGDNNLQDFGLADINELKMVGSSDNVDIVVQFDQMRDDKSRRYHLQHETDLAADLVETLEETNTGDPAVATAFFTWGIENFPSERVLALIWNHGSGIDEEDIYARARRMGIDVNRHAKPTRTSLPRSRVREIASSKLRRSLFNTTIDSAMREKAIAFDDTSRDFLDNAELKRVLTDVTAKAGRPINILGFDACLMNMVEVAYQLRGTVGYIIGSEEIEPGDGWPYDRTIGYVAANPTASTTKVATEIVKRYVASYTAADGVTQSALDVDRVTQVARAIDELASVCMIGLQSNTDYAAFGKAVTATQRYAKRDFADLGDLCAQLVARSSRAKVRQSGQAVIDLLTGSNGFVVAEGHKGSDVARSTGVAIYFPVVGDVTIAYEMLDFAKDTRWGELIRKYQEA